MGKEPIEKVELKITVVPSEWLKAHIEKWEAWRRGETLASAPMSAPVPITI